MHPTSASGVPTSLKAAVCFALALFLSAAASRAAAPFGPEQLIVTGLDLANNVRAGDLDGANGYDVFVAAESGSVHQVGLQQAGGTWSLQTLSPSASSRGIALADLDGDGDLDLLYGDFTGNRVYWRVNDLAGSGSFLPQQEIAVVAGVQGVVAADIDGDDDLDVVLAGRVADGYFWIENSAGDGSAWTKHTITTGVNAAQVVVAADLDGDGDLDVAGGSASASGKLAWYENVAGDGSTWLGRDIYSSQQIGIAAGDLDLDGDIDLLNQDVGSNHLYWWENTAGDGTAFTQHTVATHGMRAVKGLVARDLDFDGDLDVVGSPRGTWYENTAGDGSSWTARTFDAGTDLSDTDVVDLDRDGDLDILAARSTNDTISWWANLTCSTTDPDPDLDGVRGACDICPGFDDRLDADGDLVPDGCDVCPAGDDRVDNDGNGTPDACDGGASIVIASLTAAEGQSGTTVFTFAVTLSGTVAGGFTVAYATQNETATTADADYVATTGTLTFAGTDGEVRNVNVSVGGDAKVEADETFLVELGAPSNAAVQVLDGTARGTIANDDIAALSVGDPFCNEGNSGTSACVFTITSSGEVDGGFTVEYLTGDSSATLADGDYVSQSGILTFVGIDGEVQSVGVLIAGDTKVEQNEVVNLLARRPSIPAVTIPDGVGHGTIVNDDTATIAVGDVSQVETNAGTTSFVFTVTLTGSVDGGFSVPYSTSDGTATAPGDYQAASGTLTFVGTAGETQTISVLVSGDTVVEGNETFSVLLGATSNASVTASDGTGLGTIQNDDTATIAIDDVSQLETNAGTTSFVFTVTLTGTVDGGFTVPYSTSDGTASAPGDYQAASGTLIFAGTVGEAQTISVLVSGDTIVEGNETFNVLLGVASNASVTASDGTGLGTIQNDDTATIAIDDVSQLETNAGTTIFVFTVTLTGTVDGGFTVPYSTSDGTAIAPGDYQAASGTLTFAGTAGETQTISVLVVGDTVVENNEAFNVLLGAASIASVTASDGTGLGTIQNDDTATIAIDDVSQLETNAGTTSFVFTVTLTSAVDGGFTVPFNTSDGTATAPGDYLAASGTLTFAGTAGEAQTLSVLVVGDTVVEGNETFNVLLGAASNASVTASDGTGLGTIQNDDSATIAIDDVSQLETNAGTTSFVFTVTLTGSVDGGFTVPYSTSDGTATAPGDYQAASGTLTFAGTAGETQTISVLVVGDTVVESDETFSVLLGPASNASVTASDGSGLGTIQNDDSGPWLVATKEVARYEPPFDSVDYLIVITNTGLGGQLDDPATDEFEDSLPQSLELLGATSDSPGFLVVADLAANRVLGNGTLAPGESVRLSIAARVISQPGQNVANQGLIRFDVDHDGSNETTALTDDPNTPEPFDPTLLLLADLVEVPTLFPWARAFFAALLVLFALQRLTRL